MRCRKERFETRVTDAIFTFVTVNEEGKPIPVSSIVREGVGEDILEMLS